MEFLGMAKPQKTAEEIKNDPIQRMLKNEEERRLVREAHREELEDAKKDK